MGLIGVNLDFLNDIEIDDVNAKGIRFNNNERYMIKFAAYKGLNFSAYVKQLINNDIKKHCMGTDGITKDKIKELIMEVLQDKNLVSTSLIEKDIGNEKFADEDIDALGELGISRR